MRVAMLTTVGNDCGIAVYTRALTEALREFAEVEVEPIHVGKQPPEHYREQAERMNRADVVHIQHEHSFWGGILPGHSAFWTLRYLIQKPVVITAHTTLSLGELFRIREERKPHRWLAKRLLIARKGYRDSVEIAPFVTGRCIVHTEEGRRALIERGANPAYVHLIPAGVPEPAPAPTSGLAFRERFGLSDRPIVSLFGFITPNKGYELTLDVLPALGDDVHFVIAGGPRNAQAEPYAESLAAAISAAGLGPRVTITGFLSDEDVAEAMAASDVVVAPHTQATGSYSIMFPLTHGRPVLASDLAIFREIRERGQCLELFPSGDAHAYSDALRRLLEDPARRRELSEKAREYSRQHGWREAARSTLQVYEEALADVKRLAHHTV